MLYPLKTSEKRQKTFGFLTFLGGIEMGHWREKGYQSFLIFELNNQ